jgi:hypothetical protein
MKRKLIDIIAEERGTTEKAMRLFDGKRSVWLPKRFVEDNGDGTFTMPLWLAEEKELV